MSRFASLAVLLLCVPLKAEGIQLRWVSGATDVTFSTATRCTLVVQADSTEQGLPSEWRLLWVADTSALAFVPVDSLAACQSATARVWDVEPRSTPEDSTGNALTARFCSAEPGTASMAEWLLDIPGGAHGKLKVVALDRTDSTRVLQSPEVTFNGGVAGDYRALVLSATTVHQSLTFQVSATGVRLAGTEGLSLVSKDGSWQLPLSISSRSDGSITATAQIAAPVPACLLRATAGNAVTTVTCVAADPPPPEPEVTLGDGCEPHYDEKFSYTDSIIPRNVCLVTGGWTPIGWRAFHLFYTRENGRSLLANTKKNIGHATSNDLLNWDWPPDTSAIRTRQGRFDGAHVYAPMVARNGLTYYMFYGGEDEYQVQHIGVATSTDLVNWTQGDSVLDAAVLDQQGAPWFDPNPSGYDRKPQFGDPFVMQDPDVPGDWLLFFTTVASGFAHSDKVVGVATSHGNFESWQHAIPLWNTHHEWMNNFRADSAYVVDAPHAFLRDGKWWLFYMANQDSNWAQSNAYSPIDTVNAGGRWSDPQKLALLVPPAQTGLLYYWHESEHVQIPQSAGDTTTILAAYSASPFGVVFTKMLPDSPPYLFGMGCSSMWAGVDEQRPIVRKVRLFIRGCNPARSQVRLRIELPTRTHAHLAVYDVLGRQVASVVDNDLGAGATDVAWDGRDRTGAVARSGIYFARLTTASTRLTVRAPLIR
jgi:hypothetical protein